MFVKDIHMILFEVVNSFYERKITTIPRMCRSNGELYYIEFCIQEKTDFNDMLLEGSHEKLLAEMFQINISDIIKKQKTSGSFELIYNFSTKCTHKILVIVTWINKFTFFIDFSDEQEKEYKKEIEKIKKQKEIVWLNKIYSIILENSNGLNLKQIIQKTRGIKNSEKRKEFLKQLIDAEKIKIEWIKGKNRSTAIYKPISE